MTPITREIIDYAIRKEFEAAKFYRDLQARVKLNSSKKFLKELEDMELQHAEILRNYLEDQSQISLISEPTDLKISDDWDDIEIKDDLTFQEVIIIAMKREEAAMNLYNRLAENISDSAAKTVFLRLAQEESKHKYSLETMYDDEILAEN